MTDAIDVHGHFGVPTGGAHPLVDQLTSGDADVVLARAKAAGTALTCCSPLRALLPRGDTDPVSGNEDSLRKIRGRKGLRYWVVLHPGHPATFDQAEESLKDPFCVGIKIHPEEHRYPIAEQGERLFEFAARRRAVILSHSGEPNSMPEDFVRFADAHPEVPLILAHLGHSLDGNPSRQVRAAQASRHGNIYVDTSSSRSILSGLIEWAVREVGAERILYGTDTPLYFAPCQRARVDHAEISTDDKRRILRENARRLLFSQSGENNP